MERGHSFCSAHIGCIHIGLYLSYPLLHVPTMLHVPTVLHVQTTEESPDAATNQEDDADFVGHGNSAPIEPPAPLRPIIVCFASWRVKAAVMAAKKDLCSVGKKEGTTQRTFLSESTSLTTLQRKEHDLPIRLVPLSKQEKSHQRGYLKGGYYSRTVTIRYTRTNERIILKNNSKITYYHELHKFCLNHWLPSESLYSQSSTDVLETPRIMAIYIICFV